MECPYSLPIVDSDSCYCRNPRVRSRQSIVSPSVCDACQSRHLDLPMRPVPDVMPEPDGFQSMACSFRVKTDIKVRCRLCGGSETLETLYECGCPDVRQEYTTMRRVKSGTKYACCLGCKHADGGRDGP